MAAAAAMARSSARIDCSSSIELTVSAIVGTGVLGLSAMALELQQAATRRSSGVSSLGRAGGVNGVTKKMLRTYRRPRTVVCCLAFFSGSQ